MLSLNSGTYFSFIELGGRVCFSALIICCKTVPNLIIIITLRWNIPVRDNFNLYRGYNKVRKLAKIEAKMNTILLRNHSQNHPFYRIAKFGFR